jgi:hypothetical protein
MCVIYDLETKIAEINLQSINIKAAATDWDVHCLNSVKRNLTARLVKWMMTGGEL